MNDFEDIEFNLKPLASKDDDGWNSVYRRDVRHDKPTQQIPRQGEWFFLPADLDEDVLDKKYVDQSMRGNYRSMEEKITISEDRWGGGYNHKASMIVRTGGKTYIKGIVFDTTGRHHNLNFSQWKRAVRNKEVVSQTNNTYWD